MDSTIISQENFEKIHTQALKEIAYYTRKQKAALPHGEVSFYRTVDSHLTSKLDGLSERIKTKLNQMIANVDIYGNEKYEGATEASDADMWYQDIIKINDVLMEGVNIAMDEVSGRNNKFAASPTQLIPTVGKVQSKSGEVNVVYSRLIGRPQIKFEDKVDNSGAPFIPKLPDKPNSQVPLDIEGIKEGKCHPHPYHYEITNITYPRYIFQTKTPIKYLPVQSTPLTWVDKLDGLLDMCQKLENSQEIAVDLEHHNYRSYQGFTCLMQISTREEDFIIDVLELRNRLHLLNKSFTNPNILKVFHGADYDIVWLQKDFGVYVVNLFDTAVASYVLEMSQHSLAHLLKNYCNVDTDKKYQLADWRLRPLTEEMINYARTDTHYLLYIYDNMRNELIENSNNITLNHLKVTLERSAQVSLKIYETFCYDKTVFKALHEWRDSIARLEDESVNYVLPTDMLFLLAEKMPEDPDEIGECLKGFVPPLVREHALDVIMQIINAKSQASISNNIVRNNVMINKENLSSNQMEIIEPIGGLVLDVPIRKYRGSDFSAEKSILFGNTLSNETKISDEAKTKVADIMSSFTSIVPVLPRLVTTVKPPSLKKERKHNIKEELEVIKRRKKIKTKGNAGTSGSKNTEEIEEIIEKITLDFISATTTNQESSPMTDQGTSTSITIQPEEKTFNPYGQIVEDEKLRKRELRLPAAPSSGNRSTTGKR
ncbi:6377_t:CDS:10 [Diversispora eburnea]|uniref:6377_t:CDS:1 n=1 Tax=Diversispora eburnea TaxID=1213867 RepID=A0A9N8WB45_9GLOM|nr:6377_t:CDS:10 [Diversispora eburnea]